MISQLSPEHTLVLDNEYLPYLYRLKALYADMDEQYENAASHYGFICRGCDDNCCRTRFYHHTLLEYLYIMEGFKQLSGEMRRKVRKQARRVCNRMAEENIPFGHMCPLNIKERCILYAHRPMICRLHGIPHELRKPGASARYHQGCKAFHERHKGKSYFEFDRTPLYIRLSRMEKDFRSDMNMTTKLKLTVAEMLIIE
jgi:Fe-S-cluster containining protein